VSRLEEGRLEPDLKVVELDTLAREALTLADPLRGGRRLLLEVPGAVPALITDRDLLLRVLQNLVGNAIKYTDAQDGRVAIRLLEAPNGTRVEVCDNGPGIPADFLDRVFDKFCQVEARQQRRPHSSGLGLTFCKLAVELHGGCIGVTSEMGRGSVFWFELPTRPQGWAAAEE
jgi:two-component system sensor histidine kinase/response regulator